MGELIPIGGNGGNDGIDIFERDGSLWTTSLNIAEVFCMQHKNVLQAIENLECSQEFRGLNFQPSSYQSKQNRTMPMYDIREEGFYRLVMGFTGSKAALIQETYVMKFSQMKTALKSMSNVLMQSLDALSKASALQTSMLSQLSTGINLRFDEVDQRFSTLTDRIDVVESKIGDPRVKPSSVTRKRWWDFLMNRPDATANLCPCCKTKVIFFKGKPTGDLVKEGHHVYNRSRAEYDEVWYICKDCHGKIHGSRSQNKNPMENEYAIKRYKASLAELQEYEAWKEANKEDLAVARSFEFINNKPLFCQGA